MLNRYPSLFKICLDLNQYNGKRNLKFWTPPCLLFPEQVKGLELQLQKESARADQAERINTELQDEHQAACDLARSKDQLLDLGQTEINHLRESLAQATAQQEQQGTRWDF